MESYCDELKESFIKFVKPFCKYFILIDLKNGFFKLDFKPKADLSMVVRLALHKVINGLKDKDKAFLLAKY